MISVLKVRRLVLQTVTLTPSLSKKSKHLSVKQKKESKQRKQEKNDDLSSVKNDVDELKNMIFDLASLQKNKTNVLLKQEKVIGAQEVELRLLSYHRIQVLVIEVHWNIIKAMIVSWRH